MLAMGVALGSDPVIVRLSEDQATISWASVDAPTFGNVKVRECEGKVMVRRCYT